MTKGGDPTPERVRELLDYDPVTGAVLWRNTGRGRRLDRRAGHMAEDGYLYIWIDGKNHTAGRLAWIYVTGESPSGEIDHRNGRPSENWFNNLRDATHAQNMKNMKCHSDNSSGRKGVYWDKEKQKWRVQISANGDRRFLGYFTDIDEASAIHQKESQRLFGEFARVA